LYRPLKSILNLELTVLSARSNDTSIWSLTIWNVVPTGRGYPKSLEKDTRWPTGNPLKTNIKQVFWGGSTCVYTSLTFNNGPRPVLVSWLHWRYSFWRIVRVEDSKSQSLLEDDQGPSVGWFDIA
jgi:hypothetical protein